MLRSGVQVHDRGRKLEKPVPESAVAESAEELRSCNQGGAISLTLMGRGAGCVSLPLQRFSRDWERSPPRLDYPIVTFNSNALSRQEKAFRAMPQTVVLVVEDEVVLRLMAVAVVEGAGFEAIEASNADEAVRILEGRNDIRIVFTDIDMPGSMDGMKLAATVRDRWPPVEIILTSGHIAAQNVTLPERGVFFPKPYDAREVSQAMRRMIG
jgi:CheY-like chemotaxis protein